MTTSWHSYPKIYNMGHAQLAGYFDTELLIQEKVDGSQFSFGIFDGEIKIRSKGQQLVLDAPEKMFERAVATVKEIAHLLTDGWTYRGEFLGTPKHNTLKYERVPKGHIVVFDINTAEEAYLPWEQVFEECERIGVECVPAEKAVADLSKLREWLEKESFLGGTKVEGVVCKRYDLFGPDKKVLMAKHVSEAFKEVHGKEWKKSNPTGKDFIGTLADRFCAEGRWQKAIQHLKERGELTGTPQDIPKLMLEVKRDIREECTDMIVKELLSYAMPQIDRTATRGLPEWYKEKLMESQFEVPA